MKIKTLRIKIEKDHQDINLNEYFKGSNTMYDKHTHIVDEADGKYWHVMIFYESNANAHYLNTIIDRYDGIRDFQEINEKIPEDLREELELYYKEHAPDQAIIHNLLRQIIEDGTYKRLRELSNFGIIRGFGKKTLSDYKDLLMGVLEIIKKHRKYLK